MPPELTRSYQYCRKLARRAGNFYYAFWALPRDQFWAMCALYGFTRQVDDAGDDPNVSLAHRTVHLRQWRDDLNAALGGELQRNIVFPALIDSVQKYQIPTEYLFDLIDGIECDLKPVRYQSWDELSDYCYHVAGVIGLCCIHIWGFTDERAKPSAILCGQAFQLTNILRDLKEDFSNGRSYLPLDDLAKFDYSLDELGRGVVDERFRSLMAFEVSRARDLYVQGHDLTRYLRPTGQPIFAAMLQLYRGLLDEIERCNFDVFSHRVQLSRWKKLRIGLGALLCGRFGIKT